MNTYNTTWNLGHLWPKRDIACLDMEDWPKHILNRLSVGKPEYPNHVTDEMILDIEYDADNLIIEESNIVDNYPKQDVTPLTLQDLVRMRDEFKMDKAMNRWADELDAVINEYN